MSDNLTKLKTAYQGRKRVVLLCAIAAVVLLILVLVLFGDALNLDAIGRWARYGKARANENYGTVTYDAHSSNRYALWEDGLAVASIGGLETFKEDGFSVKQAATSMTNPALQTGSKVTVCYDVAGKKLLAMSEGREVTLEADAEGGYFDADISNGDTICTVSSESGYKTVLRVYDEKQQEIYRWFSASRFMPICAVSPNGKKAATVGLGEKDGAFQSTLYLFHTDVEEPWAETPLGGGLIYDLRFVSDNRICAVEEDAVYWLDGSGKVHSTFDLSSWYLDDYDMSGDGFLLLSLNMYKAGDRCSVVSVDYDGNQLGSLFVGTEVLDISACGRYAAILTTEELIICRRDLSEYLKVPNSWMATSVLMREDGTAYLMTGNTAELFIP